MAIWSNVVQSSAPASVILIRLMVGTVFLSEGIQKFLYPDQLGVGRFIKIGLPFPDTLAPFVACCETVCGLLVLAGLMTRLAVLPLISIMLVAIITTKFPMLLKDGIWKMAHESRTDFSMLLGSVFLLLVGAGPLSCDARIAARRPK